ncbi:MAG: SPFH domain-containing protein [Mycobacteriaceae bacterium]|nr:SPFH domain-containing protein [Mycobacteriaceae bacterium]
MSETEYVERVARGASGWPVLGAAVTLFLGGGAAVAGGVVLHSAAGAAVAAAGALAAAAGLALCAGLTPVAPGQARVVQLLGRYVGTVREDGLRWVNPLTTRRQVSTRVRNLETEKLKVNDADGNPIEIAAVVVWQVSDSAKAVFAVDDFEEFVAIQTETAVRHIAGSYPYDAHHPDSLSLRDNADEITGKLSAEIAARVASAGVSIVESRITRLSYAPEIAQAMLRRQQAAAVVAARRQIVDGAVGMVESALTQLSERDVVELDEERKAAMVSNLLVVLCADRDAQPVVNAGSLYQ